MLILTTFDRDDYLFAALQAGASGFLLKNGTPEDLIEAVRVLARGDALLGAGDHPAGHRDGSPTGAAGRPNRRPARPS